MEEGWKKRRKKRREGDTEGGRRGERIGVEGKRGQRKGGEEREKKKLPSNKANNTCLVTNLRKSNFTSLRFEYLIV